MKLVSVNDLELQLAKLNRKIDYHEGELSTLNNQLSMLESKIDTSLKEVDLLEKVALVFQRTSEFARFQAKSQVEQLVTKCLQYVFDSNVEFEVELKEQRGTASAEFYVTTKYDEFDLRTKPEQSRGGGVVDIVSLALRISFMQTHKPAVEGPLLLDEPAKHVSQEYIYNVGDFLNNISSMFNRQIIMVTHNNHLAELSSQSYTISLQGTESIVEKTSY